MNGEKEIDNFVERQLLDWDVASMNYNDLKSVKTKVFHFDGYDVVVQFNPNRIVSSAAKVDVKSIESRPCFLCSHNRPIQQWGLPFKADYVILVNPFPIFPKHLTIPKESHTDQLIGGHMTDMLDLATFLPNFVVFYNGPKCGASAPDHFHFQAGSKGFLPIEKDFLLHKKCSLLKLKDGVKVYGWNGYLRTVITLQSNHKQKITEIFNELCFLLGQLQASEKEPMMNILTYFDGDEWIIHLFQNTNPQISSEFSLPVFGSRYPNHCRLDHEQTNRCRHRPVSFKNK